MSTRFTVPLAATLLALAGGATDAQEQVVEQAAAGVAETEPPIIIDSDSNAYDLRSGVTRFTGNVTIRRGAMHVQAEQGTVTQEEGRITVVELEGSPTTWNDRLDDGTLVEGEARRIHYNVVTNVITLTGNARLRHEQGEFTGDELVYDLDTERMAGRGSSDSRARVIIEGETIRRETREKDGSEPPPEKDGETSAEAAGDDGAPADDGVAARDPGQPEPDPDGR